MLRFIREAQSLCIKVGALVNISMVILGPKIPMAQDLIQMLYATQDEELREKGITDHRQMIKKTNVFINHHRVIMHVSVELEPLQISILDIKQCIERFVSLGLPCLFPADGYVLGVEQVLSQVENLQHNRTFIQRLSDPISADEVERLLHPLA